MPWPRGSIVAVSLSLGLVTGCPRREAPGEAVTRPADLALSDAPASSSSAPPWSMTPEQSAMLRGALHCRDGFLFDGEGNPAPIDVAQGLWSFESGGGFGWVPDPKDGSARITLVGRTGAITGPLTTPDVDGGTCNAFRHMHSCFRAETRTKPKLAGTLALEVDVALNGKVMDTRRVGGTLTGKTLLACLANAMTSAQYTMPKAKTTFRYDLQLTTHALLSPRAVQIVESGVSFGGPGKVPPAIVKRIVRASFPRFRRCYELGIDADPKLKGNVTISFSIDASGGLLRARSGPTTMPHKGVVSCVLSVFRTLSFPGPEGGEVDVVLPLAFADVP